MAFDKDGCKDRVCGFCAKFYTLVIALLMTFFNLLYGVGVVRYIAAVQSFSRLEVAHFLGFAFSVVANLLYYLLHCIPTKRYRMMHLLTGCFMCALFFTAHSLGATGPTVDSCDENVAAAESNVINAIKTVQGGSRVIPGATVSEPGQSAPTPTLEPLGYLGQSLAACGEETTIFVATLFLNVLVVIALMDVQRQLLGRLKNKSYGERFVEMGIQ